MIARAAALALADVLAPESRAALLRTLLLTIAGLGLAAWGLLEGVERLAGVSLDAWIAGLPDWTNPTLWTGPLAWLGWIVAALAIGLLAALLIVPVSAIVAGLFLDGAAGAIERRHYPGDRPGEALPLGVAIPMALRFLGVVIVANLLALVLLLVPGINAVAFLLVNGYLLGREFFDFAAMRQRPIAEARDLRSRHGGTVMLAGLLLAGLLAVPVVNLAVPLFGAALMVHLHKAIAERDVHVINAPVPMGRVAAGV